MKSSEWSQLIAEMDEIEAMAAAFQSVNPGDAKEPSAESVRTLRQRYLRWLEQCKSGLNDSGKQTMQSHYSGGGYNIHRYVSDPGGTTYGNKSNRGSSYYYWNNEFKANFKKPFNEQRLLLMRIEASAKVREASPPKPPPPPTFDTIRFHSRVRAVSAKLFKDGHYRQAILAACIALNEAVQQRSGRPDLDGVALMNKVFSPEHPILKFDGHPDEQQGFLRLYSGMVFAIRNPRSHQVGETEDLDANEALEGLALVSFLFRALDTTIKGDQTSPVS